MVGVAAFLAVPTIAFAARASLVLAAGYVGHAVWDAIHHDKGVDTRIPWWYVPAQGGMPDFGSRSGPAPVGGI